MICIVDYGVGNILAFKNLFKRLSIDVKIAKDSLSLSNASRIILPGVGSFDYAMQRLNSSGMREELDYLVLEKKIPVIGICVGMQIMCSKSEEGNLNGLNWINAEVRKFNPQDITYRAKTPHMGWNDVKVVRKSDIFNDLERNPIFYFLHSYYVHCFDSNDQIGLTKYGIEFTSAFCRNNIFGIQFHPEKSHDFGEKLLENFVKNN